MAGKFEVFTGKNDKHYFKLKAGNGEVILASQGYAAAKDCANGIESVRRNAANVDRFEVLKAADDSSYFVLKATNGQVIGKSQMYKTESGCTNGIDSVQRHAADATVVEVSTD
jgi:uncharacterized protein YegP (UPF0339 family)